MAVKTHTTADVRPGELREHEENTAAARLAGSKQLRVVSPLHESLGQTFSSSSTANSSSCDACALCEDTCDNPDCPECDRKAQAPPREVRNHVFPFGPCDCAERYYTRCELRRHCTEDSAWLLCGDTIYDATPFLEVHPGGKQSILRKAGGAADCSGDMAMHSKSATKRWKSKKIGKLRKCEKEIDMDPTEDQCVIS